MKTFPEYEKNRLYVMNPKTKKAKSTFITENGFGEQFLHLLKTTNVFIKMLPDMKPFLNMSLI